MNDKPLIFSGRPVSSNSLELERARELILRYGWNSTAYQILNPGMSLWFSSRAMAVVGYVECYGFRVVAGAPVCDDEHFADVVDEFEQEAHNRGVCVCYFGAGQRLADVLARRGPFDRILLGAEPVWNPVHWSGILARKASVRAQLNRAKNKGVVVTEWSPERATHHPELERCLREWLGTRGLPPLHFLVEPETLAFLGDRHVYVAEQQQEVVGFLITSPVAVRNGWLVEQIIRGNRAPNGTNELLLDAAMQSLANSGASFVTLGLSPLSSRAGIPQTQQSVAIRLLLKWVRAHGRRFYNFDGLDAFKAKFLPDRWEPIYAITNEKRVSLRTLYAIAGAFSGYSPILFVMRGTVRALLQEIVWLARKVVGKAERR
jgi:phosphatidylglycerol lysyltransferase